MILDFVRILENGGSVRLPRPADAVRVFLVLRAKIEKRSEAPPGGYAYSLPKARARARRALHGPLPAGL